MHERHLILYLVIGIMVGLTACAKRIPLSYDQVQPNAMVKIVTSNGQTYRGLVHEKHYDYLSLKLQPNEPMVSKINRDDIETIAAKPFVTDASGGIISDWEIARRQRSKNFYIYTAGGAALSFGTSFFIGSLINRSMDDPKQGEKAMWVTTGIGSAVGTYLFSRAGRQRDRSIAIEEIRDQRIQMAKERLETEQSKRKQVRTELEKEKQERARQEAEIERLKEQIKKSKKQPNN
ncbi:MAG: hypothetical protein ONB16_11950 [candidate division KSB1 bacterium]|nr:hypothetical protein [candidate division KSB1 bacterium]